MLTEWPEYDSAACFFETCSAPLQVSKDTVSLYDTSFRRQMRQLIDAPDSVHSCLRSSPDAYVVTANSAVPVAASIQGLYSALGLRCPPITYIGADRKTAAKYSSETHFPQDEVERLKRFLRGARHVNIIDQFVDTGLTIGYGAALLHHAGVPQVSGVRGKWYAHIEPTHVDKESLTTGVDSLMKEIGRSAAKS